MNNIQKISRVSLSEDGQRVEFRPIYADTEKEFLRDTFKAFLHMHPSPHWSKVTEQIGADDLRTYADYFKADVEPIVWTALSGAPDTFEVPLEQLHLNKLAITPFPFQCTGIAYGIQHTRCIIGDDMGLGKTLQALGIADATQCKTAIVICPATIKTNWQRAIEEALPGTETTIWGTGKQALHVADWVIVNYDNLKKYITDLCNLAPDILIIDEGHYLKSPKSQRTKAVMELAKYCTRIVILTGTPIQNRPSELPSLLDILGYLKSFGGWFSFVRKYCGAFKQRVPIRKKGGGMIFREVWNTSGATNLEELNQKLQELCMIRRRKFEVLKDLPSKTRCRVVLPINNRREYASAQANLAAYVAAAAAENKAFKEWVATMPPEQKAIEIEKRKAEAVNKTDRAEQLMMIETLKQIAARGKLDGVTEWIENLLDTGEKLVVFATHIEIQQELFKRFPGAARIASEDDHAKRQQNIDKFCNQADCQLIVCSLIAGGTGVDGLQDVCTNSAMVELDWVPARHLQGEDRIYRIGQEKPVTIWYLLAEDTIEEDIQAMLASKQAVCDSVLDGAADTGDGSIFNELLDVMVQRGRV